ncbi:RNA polymerase sigma factor [Acidobacteriota bacterium]
MFEPWIRDILLASQNGDTRAFEKLVETYQGYAFSLARRFLGNEEDAQDVVQEAFIRVWKHLPAFDYRCKFTTWMYRIVTNLCLDRVKSLKVQIDITLEKRFAWFFTYFSYREIYRDFFPFKGISLEENFSPEELKIVELYLSDEDKAEEIYPEDFLDKIWKKFDTWAARAIFEEFYLILLEGAKKLNSPDLKPELVISQKEVIFAACRGLNWFEKKWLTKVLKKCAEVLQTPDIRKIPGQDKKAFSQFEGKLQALDNLTGDEFTNEVMMPGLITDTNAGTVKGSKVTWKFNMGNFFLTDYEMWVISRRVNWWVVGIAAFVLVLVIAALIAGTVIRRKRRA